MAKLEEAYQQVTKRLDDVHGGVQQLRGAIHTELQLRTELDAGLRSQFWQFAALVLPLWLAAAARLFRHSPPKICGPCCSAVRVGPP